MIFSFLSILFYHNLAEIFYFGNKIALALDTTPDEFLIGSIRHENEEWRDVAELLRGMDLKQLRLARNLLIWLSEQKL